jgi:hypothetical protein
MKGRDVVIKKSLEQLVKEAESGDACSFQEIARRAQGGDREAILARERLVSGISTYDQVEGIFPWA